jgi:hypothetical protein
LEQRIAHKEFDMNKTSFKTGIAGAVAAVQLRAAIARKITASAGIVALAMGVASCANPLESELDDLKSENETDGTTKRKRHGMTGPDTWDTTGIQSDDADRNDFIKEAINYFKSNPTDNEDTIKAETNEITRTNSYYLSKVKPSSEVRYA